MAQSIEDRILSRYGRHTPLERPATFREFEFVNGRDPFRNKDPEIRRLVRAHVVKDSSRRKRELKQQGIKSQRYGSKQKEQKKELSTAAFSSSNDGSSVHSPQPFSKTIPRFSRPPRFPSLGLDPHPQLSPIIYHLNIVGSAMYPLESAMKFNPLSAAPWFDFALSDETLFHALLYTTSTYAGLILGSTESKDSIVHVGKSVSLLNRRLKGLGSKTLQFEGVDVEDATIGAVSCLAITEALRGNFGGWKVHMTGVQQMAGMKGGISELSTTLQLKLHRADTVGSIDFLCAPFFSASKRLPIHRSSFLSQQSQQTNETLMRLLTLLPISADLFSILSSLSNFSNTVSQILANPFNFADADQISFLTGTYSLRYALLESPAFGLLDPGSSDLSDPVLDEVLRVGALLYMQATLQEFPSSAVGSRNLLQRLKESIMAVKVRNEREGALMVWLLFIGGIAARMGEERVWFVAQLGKLVCRLGLRSWDVVREELEGLWWVERIHGEICKRLWEEAVVVRNVMNS